MRIEGYVRIGGAVNVEAAVRIEGRGKQVGWRMFPLLFLSLIPFLFSDVQDFMLVGVESE